MVRTPVCYGKMVLTYLAVDALEARLAFANMAIKNVSPSGVFNHLTLAIVFTWVRAAWT